MAAAVDSSLLQRESIGSAVIDDSVDLSRSYLLQLIYKLRDNEIHCGK